MTGVTLQDSPQKRNSLPMLMLVDKRGSHVTLARTQAKNVGAVVVAAFTAEEEAKPDKLKKAVRNHGNLEPVMSAALEAEHTAWAT